MFSREIAETSARHARDSGSERLRLAERPLIAWRDEMKKIVTLMALAGLAGAAQAQSNTASIKYEVLDSSTNTWGSSVNVLRRVGERPHGDLVGRSGGRPG